MKSHSKSGVAAPAGRRRGMIGMETFVHRNGSTGKAINAMRKRKEKKRNETAKSLRQYRKVMKREGYEPGVGASRKRSRRDEEEHSEEEHRSSSDNAREQQQQQSHSIKIKVAKSNRFTKSMKQAQQNKLNEKEKQLEIKQQEKQRQKRLIERQKMTRKLSKRTKKGQPIMKNMVDNLLMKLKSQQQQNQQER